MKEQTAKKHPQAKLSPELTARAKAGDQAAFAELYEQTSPILYRSIRSMVWDEDLSWDILQDSYLRAFQSLDKLEANEAFLPWLRRIAVNVTADKMSKKLPLTFTELSGEETEPPELPDLDPEVQPELALDRKESSRLVREILAGLPEEQHLILGLRYYEELSVREISELLGVAQGTVKAQLFRGRKRVEAEVRALEKKGLKLYGLSPVAYLGIVLRRLEPLRETEQAALRAVLAQTPAAARPVAAAQPVAAATAGRALLHGLAGKLLAAAMALVMLGGGIWIGSRLLGRSDPELGDFQPTGSSAALSSQRSSGETEEPGTVPPSADSQPETEAPTEAPVTEAARPAEPGTETEPKPSESTEPSEATEPSEPAAVRPGVFDRSYAAPYQAGMTAVQTPLLPVPRLDAENGETLWAHHRLEILLTAAMRDPETGAETEWYLVLPMGLYKGGSIGWLPADRVVPFEEGAEQPANAAYGLTEGASYEEDGQEKQFSNENASGWRNCFVIRSRDSQTGRLTLKGADGNTIRVSGMEALEPYPGSIPVRLADDPDSVVPPEEAEPELPTIDREELRVLMQDAKTFAQGSYDFYDIAPSIRFRSVERIGDRYRGTVERAVVVTVSEAEMKEGRARGWIELQGEPYLYLNGSEEAAGMGILNWDKGSCGTIYRDDLGYNVERIGDRYWFYFGVGGITRRIEEITDSYWLWMDPDTPLLVGPSEYEDAPKTLGECGESLRLDAYPYFDEETGELKIYADVR